MFFSILEITENGSMILLSDGQTAWVRELDVFISNYWLPSQRVVFRKLPKPGHFLLCNLEMGQSVEIKLTA